MDLGGVVLCGLEEIGTAEGSETRACCGKGDDGNLSFVSEVDDEVGLR